MSCDLLNASGVAVELLGSSTVLPANMPRQSDQGLAKVMTAWRSSTPRSTFSTRSLPLVAAIDEPFVLAAGGVDLGLQVLPGDRGAVAPHRLGVDRVGDHLRVGAGQLDAGEEVGVDGGRAVGGDPEGARHRRAHERSRLSPVLPSMCNELKFGGKSFNASRRLPPCCRLAGSCGLMSLVLPTSADPPADGASSLLPEQAVRVSAVIIVAAARRRSFMPSDSSGDRPLVAVPLQATGGCTRAGGW